MKLRQYQEDALAAERRHRAEHPEETRLAIVMATGLGKGTIIAARAVRAIEDPDFSGRVLILAPTEEIVTDLAARCRLLAGQGELPISVGIVMNIQDETSADIVVASVQTLLSPERRARIKNVGLVIADECELYAAQEWRSVLAAYGCFGMDEDICEVCEHVGRRHLREARLGAAIPCVDCKECTGFRTPGATPLLGFTATLRRGDGLGLGDLWQDVAFTRDISWGVRHGYLVQPVGHRLEIDMGGGHPFSTDAVDQDWQLIESLAPEKIVEKWQELAADRPTIAFMPLVRSARVLTNAFHAAGVKAELIWGDMPGWQRKEALKAYADGTVQVLVNAMVLTRGFDAPKTSCVIVGRPTKSVNLGIQMAGRGLRPVPGIPVEDQDCLLIYVQDATTDLFCHADLSDRPVDRKATGALTAMEDAWDIGAHLEDEARHWTGKVSTTEFDPLVRRSSKAWKTTKGGAPFLPIGKDGQYVFLVGTRVFMREPAISAGRFRTVPLSADLPDLDVALQVAEDEATDRGGDVGALLADRSRAWRRGIPSADMQAHAQRLGLGGELIRIMEAHAGGKAGKLSDLIGRVEATRAIDPLVARIREATS